MLTQQDIYAAGLLEDVYAAVDSCETAKEIWERVRQIMKGSNIGEQEKKAKLFNEWEKFMNKHFPKNIASNLKFLNNLQPEWNRHVTIVRQTKNLHEVDFTHIYDFLKMNQDEDRQTQNVGGNGGNQFGQYAGQVAHNQQGCNAWQNGIANQNGTGDVVVARAKGTRNENQARCYNYRGLGHIALNYTARPKRRDAAYLQTQLLIAQKEEARIQLQAEEFDFMAAAGDLDEIEEVNTNCIFMENLQHASTSGTQLDKAPVYDTDGSAEVHLNDNCYDSEIFNMFTHKEHYTDLLEPIPEPQLVPQNDNHVTYVAPSMVQSRGTIEISSAPNKETHAHQETIYRNLVDQVTQVNMVNCNMRATNAELKSELARYKIQEQRIEISQEKYDKLEKWVFVPQKTKSKEELFLSNVSNMVTFSKMISIRNEDLSDNTTPSVAQKFVNEVKSSLVTLQRVVKQKMTLEVHNWSSSAHKEVHRIISYEITPIINQVNARVKNFKIQFPQEAAKFVRDFKSLAKEADESLDKQKSLELEIERLLKASVNHDIMSIVQNGFVDVPSDLQTELDHTKEKL
nr:hypothetical protein [Tanacetum cinerariifolium]